MWANLLHLYVDLNSIWQIRVVFSEDLWDEKVILGLVDFVGEHLNLPFGHFEFLQPNDAMKLIGS